MRHLPILLVLVVPAGCAGTLHDRLNSGHGLVVRSGMTDDQVQQILGTPDTITHDRRCLYARRFWWQSPSRDGKTEWAWTDRDPVVVIWLRQGRVVGMGTVPKDRALPGPSAAETYVDSAMWGVAPFGTEFQWCEHRDDLSCFPFLGDRVRRRH